MVGGVGNERSRSIIVDMDEAARWIVMTSPDRTMTTSTPSPKATSRGNQIASPFLLLKVRVRTMVTSVLVYPCVYQRINREHNTLSDDASGRCNPAVKASFPILFFRALRT